jgi:hypothetical protein
MRSGVALLLAWSAMITSATGLLAQTSDSDRLQTFTRSEFYKSLVNRALAAIPQTIFQRCPTLVSNGSRVVVIKPVSFGSDGFPNAGMWKQSFPVSGCGNDTILNLYFFAGADEKINTTIGVPGATHADLALQRDALLYARIGAARVIKHCKAFEVKSTRFEAYGLQNPPMADPGQDKPLRPWWETWTMVGCDHTIDVPIDFVPDSTGTRIIQPTDTVKR